MSSRARIVNFIQEVRASYWFLPSALAVLAAFTAEGMLWLDAHNDILPFQLPEALRDTQIDGARNIMGVIAQSVFGVAGVMFSMTVVAVSFASGNFGPRLISNFMRDRGNQWSLGILISTFVYALLVLRGIQSGAAESADLQVAAFVPHFSILLALVATSVSIFTVIYFVHHIPETINVSNISAGLGRRLLRDIKGLIDAHNDEDGPEMSVPERLPDQIISLDQVGYIQTLNKTQAEIVASDNDVIIEIVSSTGKFMTPDAPLLRIWGKQLDDAAAKELRDCFALGESRTEHQNLLFLIDQLVEMVARALSPGINDPFTAINCLNWLHAALVVAGNYEGGLQAVSRGPVLIKSLSFEDLLDASFGKSQAYVETDHLAMAHMRRILAKLDADLKTASCRDSVKKFARSLDEDS